MVVAIIILTGILCLIIGFVIGLRTGAYEGVTYFKDELSIVEYNKILAAKIVSNLKFK